MTKTELREKMLEFLDTKQAFYPDEFYATHREMAQWALQEFAEYLKLKPLMGEEPK